MIVTPCAADRQSEERFTGRADDVGQTIVDRGNLVVRLVVPHSDTVVAGRNDRIERDIVDFVAGKLLDDETIERLVLVEGFGDRAPRGAARRDARKAASSVKLYGYILN